MPPAFALRPLLLSLLLLVVAVAAPAAARAQALPPEQPVTGTVVSAVDGTPVAGVHVRFASTSADVRTRDPSDAEGRFGLKIRAGTYMVEATNDDAEPFTGTDDRWLVGPSDGSSNYETAPRVTVAEGQPLIGVVVRVAPRPRYDVCRDGLLLEGYEGPDPAGPPAGCPRGRIPRITSLPWDYAAVVYVLGTFRPTDAQLAAAGFTRDSLRAAGEWILAHPDAGWPTVNSGVIALLRHGIAQMEAEAQRHGTPSPVIPLPSVAPVVLGQPTRVPSNGSFGMPVACVGSDTCRGTVTLTTRAPAAGRRGSARMVTIARRSVRSRRTGTVARLRLNATGRRLLRTRKRIVVTVAWKAPGQRTVSERRTVRRR
ncbi:hypothetical protein PAI11_01890 [Patulibacter medicamentivorans]|uniref:Carboxypeptidase regulatory-like domain-containing protein n=1 Tax=Patulibacter medicamentivorans TaxID=1097667 RepID=H0E081_9ACTN|nr:carboxypeptidase-like regulatory domain-containing protein [Patulibacter medicamentivorans]EHN12884.1 hypothetical protein PAI11_01890 [Patulibacter medicamentivorans]